MVNTGLDVALEWLAGADPGAGREAASLLRGGRLGLVTNPSAVTRELEAAPDALRRAGANVAALFGPEHGVRGEAPDGVAVGHSADARLGVPVWSLYGETRVPSAEMLQGLDALVFDTQDVGSRFYTFSSTLSHVMGAARSAGLPLIMLDRPNPLGGVELEGPVLDPAFASFVGLHPVPIRHGATLGETGRLWAAFGAGEEPLVVACRRWSRSVGWSGTGLSWVPPSPNMPSAETALLYPGMCLLEGTNVSEGRGTACPFRWFGAPWIDAEALADALNAEALEGVRFRPVRFIPTSSKFAGTVCSGCQVHVTDTASFRPVRTGVTLLGFLRAAYPQQFAWRQSGESFSLDRLAGTDTLRRSLDADTCWREIEAAWKPGLDAYREQLSAVALYG